MSEQQDVPSVEAEKPNPYARRRRRWHWLLAFAILAGGTYYIMGRPGEPAVENVPPEMQVTAPPAESAPPPPPMPDSGAVMPPEENRAPASAEADPLADPLAPIESGDMNQPPPAPTPTEEAVAPIIAEPAPEPPPEAAPAPAPKLKLKKKTEAKKKTKSYKLVFSKTETKVPSGLKKDKVLKYLAKKLDGDKSCLPKALEKKDAKSFTAIVNVSKTGAVTAVTTQPKMPESKKIASCIKKKLAGSPATFKGKGKASARITVALKMK